MPMNARKIHRSRLLLTFFRAKLCAYAAAWYPHIHWRLPTVPWNETLKFPSATNEWVNEWTCLTLPVVEHTKKQVYTITEREDAVVICFFATKKHFLLHLCVYLYQLAPNVLARHDEFFLARRPHQSLFFTYRVRHATIEGSQYWVT